MHQTLVDSPLWSSSGKGQSQQTRLIQMLRGLLAEEITVPMNQDKKQLLAEYREHFEWETEYTVRVDWQVYIDSIEQEITCSSLTEFEEYLDGSKEPEEATWDDLEHLASTPYTTGEFDTRPNILVINFRLKETEQQQLAKVVADAIARTGIDPEEVPQLMPFVYQHWELPLAFEA